MRAVELFAGAGGMSLGLKRAGFDVVAAYDSWQAAVDSYRANLGGYVRQTDLKDIFNIAPAIVAQRPDLIAGGPPCQDFSAAGGRVEGERAGLTRAFAMLVCIARPEWFLMENVPQAASSIAWQDAQAMLVRAGYGLTEARLNASFYGVPQARKRLFVVGRLGEQDGFLESALAAARSERPMTVRDMLGGIPDAALAENGFVYARPLRAGRGVLSVDEPFSTVTRSSFEGLHERYIQNPHPKDPIPATSAAVPTREQISRIQGFPQEWDWSVAGVRAVEQMVANAVPPPLAEAIGRAILARDAGETIPEIQGRFSQWLRRKQGFSKAAIWNCRTRVNRARRLLGGRTFADGAAELAALEATEGFDSLATGTKSDLRRALRLYREWQIEPKVRGKVKGEAAEALAAAA